MNFARSHFQIGFWHPFGPHDCENADQILNRKRDEIAKEGWALWSFQFRKTLALWWQEIEKAKPRKMLVLCSQGKVQTIQKDKRLAVSITSPLIVPFLAHSAGVSKSLIQWEKGRSAPRS
jgi:hypothetical protein